MYYVLKHLKIVLWLVNSCKTWILRKILHLSSSVHLFLGGGVGEILVSTFFLWRLIVFFLVCNQGESSRTSLHKSNSPALKHALTQTNQFFSCDLKQRAKSHNVVCQCNPSAKNREELARLALFENELNQPSHIRRGIEYCSSLWSGRVL